MQSSSSSQSGNYRDQSGYAGVKREASDITMLDYNSDDETEDDDDACLDLTQQSSLSGNYNTTTSPDSTRQRSPDPLQWLVDDNISEEALVAMGIDIAEIRAQREIERRLELEAKQLEYAQQLQAELDREAGRQPTNIPAAPASTSAMSSSTVTPSVNTPNTSMSSFRMSNGTTVDNFNKRFKSDHNTPYTPPGMNNTNTASSSSSSSSSAVPSSSVAASRSTAPARSNNVFVIDDDSDLVDLTDTDTGQSSSSAILVDGYDYCDSDDELCNGSGVDINEIMYQMELIHRRNEAKSRYGIDLFMEPDNCSRPRAPPIGSHPRGSVRPSTAHRISIAQAEDELRTLLETINDEEPPPPESRVGTPAGLKINLLEHQKVGFQWMTKQEMSGNRGGLLTDDMGLGKTIQALSIIVSRRCENATPPPDEMTISARQQSKRPTQLIKAKSTLVVCPVSLMQQWSQEIRLKTENVSVYIHHGPQRLNDAYEIANFDVIITSYHMISGEFPEDSNRGGVLKWLIFHRVILDEAHSIKNRTTNSAKACCRINADYRWCLTATPIQNRIEELYSLINFLRIRPYCEWEEFRDVLIKPLKNGDRTILKKVQVILKAIALRRSKKAKIDGRPILNLPERNVHFTHVDFTPQERQFYDYVDNKVQNTFNNYVEAGTVMNNYSNVLVLLLRLRQACLHPSLTNIELPDIKNDNERHLGNCKSMDKTIVDRLLERKDELEAVECPICMDTAIEARIISKCGHILCQECLYNYVNTDSDYGGTKSCPECRGELVLNKVLPVAMFLKVYLPSEADIKKSEEKEDELEAQIEQVRKFTSSKKIDTMMEILAKTRVESKGRDKTIIFSQFTTMLDIMEKPLKMNGYHYGRYDGSMTLKDRNKTIEKFYNDPDMEILLVSTKCGSLGLNLTIANRVILMDIWWNPALENQAIDRVHRIGQTKNVEVHRIFIKNTVEDRILELQRKKQAIADGALGEGAGNKLGRLGLQEMLYLFRGGQVPEFGSSSR